MSIPLLDAHRRAQQVFGEVLAGLDDANLTAATPCPEWTARDLVMHVIAGNCRAADLPVPSAGDAEHLRTEHARTAAAAQAAFEAPGGLDRVVELAIGPVPAQRFLVIRATDVFTHGWDLAVALGRSPDLDAELAEELLELARQTVRPEFRGPGRPFEAEQTAPLGAPCRYPARGVPRAARAQLGHAHSPTLTSWPPTTTAAGSAVSCSRCTGRSTRARRYRSARPGTRT